MTDKTYDAPWWERYAAHRSPLLRFAARERRAPTFLEKLAVAPSEAELEDLLAGARDVYRWGFASMLPDPVEIKDTAKLRRAELGKAAAVKARK